MRRELCTRQRRQQLFEEAKKQIVAEKEFKALDDISFEVKRGEAFGLVGTNGSGKSTMLKIIAGVLEPSKGTCEVKGTIAPLIELGAGMSIKPSSSANSTIWSK